MNIQGALDGLVKAFIAFYIGCVSVGRADIPLKLLTELRANALSGARASWGCPSVFNPKACSEYDPRRYR